MRKNNERGIAIFAVMAIMTLSGFLFGGPWYFVFGDSNTFDNSEDVEATITQTINGGIEYIFADEEEDKR